MNIFRRFVEGARGLLGGRPKGEGVARAETVVQPRRFHLLGPGMRPACGRPPGADAILTVERHVLAGDRGCRDCSGIATRRDLYRTTNQR